MIMPQIEPVTRLSKDYKSVFAKLLKGPVFLAQRSKPAAVLLSIREYEKMVEQIKRYEGITEAKKAIARIDNGQAETISHDDLMQLMLEKM